MGHITLCLPLLLNDHLRLAGVVRGLLVVFGFVVMFGFGKIHFLRRNGALLPLLLNGLLMFRGDEIDVRSILPLVGLSVADKI